jgi:hypothetical protein
MALLCGRTERLISENGGFWSGQIRHRINGDLNPLEEAAPAPAVPLAMGRRVIQMPLRIFHMGHHE